MEEVNNVVVAHARPARLTGAQTPSLDLVDGGNGQQRQSDAAVKNSAVSVMAVAEDAAKEKMKSLEDLKTVSESIQDAVEVLNEALSLKHTSAVIRHDKELNRYLVTIKDKESGEVVRQIPDEALLKFARNLAEMRGILFDETT